MNTPLSPSPSSVQKPSQSSIIALFRRPFPIVAELPASSLRTALAFGAFVTLFLTMFPPLNLGMLPLPIFYIHTFGYGLLCSGIMLINFFGAPRLLPHVFVEERWTVGRHIAFSLWNVLSVALGNIVYTAFVFNSTITGIFIVRFIIITLSIGAFPIIILTLVQERRLLRRNIDSAEKIAAQLHESPSSTDSQGSILSDSIQEAFSLQELFPQAHPHPERQETNSAQEKISQSESKAISIIFEGAGMKERFETMPERIVCLQASDNYVEIFVYADDSKQEIETVLLRMTLKYAEERMNTYSRIIRCHKSYIVNLDHVCDISGNAQGYKLQIPNLDFTIPVSRSYQERILHAFEEHYLELKHTLDSARRKI